MGRAKHIEQRIEKLMTEERVERPPRSWKMKIDFAPHSGSGRDALALQDVSIGYADLVLLAGLNLNIRYGERVALTGTNGSGKTTLLKTIAGITPPLAGQVRVSSGVKMGYMTQEQEDVAPQANALEAIGAIIGQNETEIRAYLSKFLFKGDEVFIPANMLSYGERARLALAMWVGRGVNFLMLDEPINHLDIPARTQFEQALARFDGTVLAVVHDRYFIEGFATRVWAVLDGKIREV